MVKKEELTYDDVKSLTDEVAKKCNLNFIEKEDRYGIPIVTKDNTLRISKLGKNDWYLMIQPDKDKKIRLSKKAPTTLYNTTSQNSMIKFLDNMGKACDLKKDVGSMEHKCELLGGKVVSANRLFGWGDDQRPNMVCSFLDAKNRPTPWERETFTEPYFPRDKTDYILNAGIIKRIDVVLDEAFEDKESGMYGRPKYYYAYLFAGRGAGGARGSHVILPINEETFNEWLIYNDNRVAGTFGDEGYERWKANIERGNIKAKGMSMETSDARRDFVISFYSKGSFGDIIPEVIREQHPGNVRDSISSIKKNLENISEKTKVKSLKKKLDSEINDLGEVLNDLYRRFGYLSDQSEFKWKDWMEPRLPDEKVDDAYIRKSFAEGWIKEAKRRGEENGVEESRKIIEQTKGILQEEVGAFEMLE